MLRRFFAKLFFILLVSRGVEAMNPYIACGKTLVAIKEQGHSVPSLSREATEAARKFLSAFREQHFRNSRFDYRPQSQASSADSSSSMKAKQAVARRISALLQADNGDIGIEGNSEPNATILFAGSLIDGQEVEGQSELRKYIQTLSAAELALRSQPGEEFENFREHLVPFFIAPVMTSVLAWLWIYAIYNPRLIPFVFLVSIAPYPLVEKGMRGIYHFSPRFKSEEKWLTNRLSAFERNRWFYDSHDYVLDREAFLKTWSTGEMSGDLMVKNFTNLLAPRITKPKGASGYVPKPTVVLQFDRLFTSDPSTGKPVFAVFVRAYDKRPRYPKPVAQKAAQEISASGLATLPGGAR